VKKNQKQGPREPLSIDDLRTVDTRGAFEATGIPVRQLEALRYRGGGPPFIRCGRERGVRYRLVDLLAWLQQHSRTSTSDLGPNA
jgi:hypothetical protein